MLHVLLLHTMAVILLGYVALRLHICRHTCWTFFFFLSRRTETRGLSHEHELEKKYRIIIMKIDEHRTWEGWRHEFNPTHCIRDAVYGM